MGFETILVKEENSTITIELNRKGRLNAINRQMLAELTEVLTKAAQDRQVRVVVITGGKDVFSAGADLTEAGAINNTSDAFNFISAFHTTFNLIESFARPVIAAVGGIALGGGCELALACDIRIAADTARFGVPEINIGALPGGGGTQRLPRLVGPARAKEMLFGGGMVPAARALEIGLANRVVPVTDLQAEAQNLAREYAQKPLLALSAAKVVVNQGLEADLPSALELEKNLVTRLFGTFDRQEGMRAFLEKRKPVFKGE